eukprot:Hpha_TRINITY_DN15236_c2_g2::TRINITY_DN15236_c2_g2_i1::g.65444::m.65444
MSACVIAPTRPAALALFMWSLTLLCTALCCLAISAKPRSGFGIFDPPLQRGINSHEVTAALARYDVDGAETVITSGKDLPSELAESLLQLLANLRSYKAYLPHSCLVPGVDNTPEHSSVGEAREAAGPAAAADEAVQPSGGMALLSFDSESECEESHRRRSSVKSDTSMTTTSSMLKAQASRRRVSIAGGNMTGYLSTYDDLTGESHLEWMSADVERWCAAVLGAKGVVDLMGGDRRYASFNARQRCGGHVVAAVEALWSWGEGAWSGCVVTGQAVCGDFGTTSMLRFMVLGRVASSLNP